MPLTTRTIDAMLMIVSVVFVRAWGDLERNRRINTPRPIIIADGRSMLCLPRKTPPISHRFISENI
jgi:hypothetical protein